MAKLKPGHKLCPSCHKVIGARSTTCPECGATIPTKGKAKPKAPRETLRTTLERVKAAGGVSALQKKLDAAEKALEALEPFGTLESARDALAEVKELESLLK